MYVLRHAIATIFIVIIISALDRSWAATTIACVGNSITYGSKLAGAKKLPLIDTRARLFFHTKASLPTASTPTAPGMRSFRIYFTSQLSTTRRVSIFTVSGKRVFASDRIASSSLLWKPGSKGVYLVSVQCNGVKSVKRIHAGF